MSRRLFICSAGHLFFTSGELPVKCPRSLVYLDSDFFGRIKKNKDGTDKIKEKFVCYAKEVYEMEIELVSNVIQGT